MTTLKILLGRYPKKKIFKMTVFFINIPANCEVKITTPSTPSLTVEEHNEIKLVCRGTGVAHLTWQHNDHNVTADEGDHHHDADDDHHDHDDHKTGHHQHEEHDDHDDEGDHRDHHHHHDVDVQKSADAVTSTLTVSEAEAHDAGEYKCTCDMGSVVSVTVQVEKTKGNNCDKMKH